MNYFRDEEEDFRKIQTLCRFINPKAASEIWDKKEDAPIESVSNTFLDDVQKDLKGKYSKEELQAIFTDPQHYSELNKIEKV